MGEIDHEAVKVRIAALAHARTTASNDDYSVIGDPKRARHVERITAMLDAETMLSTLLAKLEQAEREQRITLDHLRNTGAELGQRTNERDSALAQLAAVRQENAWRGIESAPRYIEILTFSPNGCYSLMRLTDDDRKEDSTLVWKDWDGSPIDEPSHVPTRWWPLPTPPSDTGGGE
jgi:hypothetical protein